MHYFAKALELYREGSGVVHSHGLTALGKTLAVAFLRFASDSDHGESFSDAVTRS